MEIIYLMCAENKSLAWTVGDEQASPSLDLVTTNLASSVLSKGAEKPDAKGKKGKAGKDPNKPKRAPSTFFVFMGEFREEFKQKNPKNKSVAAERLPMCPRPTSSRASTTRPLLPTTRVSHLCHRRLVLPSWLVLLHLVAARCTPAAAQPRHDSGSLRWFPRRRWMAPPQPRWRPCMASASKIPCGHMKKGWSISDDSSHGATGNLMWCFHPLDIASSSAWSPFQ